jgi:hypothetical protein
MSSGSSYITYKEPLPKEQLRILYDETNYRPAK